MADCTCGGRRDVRNRRGCDGRPGPTVPGVSTMQVKIPDDAVLYSPLTELALRQLRPGEQLRINTLDPITMRTLPVICEAIRREPVSHGGEEISAMLLNVTYQGMTISSWMNDDGTIIRQETPLGWDLDAGCECLDRAGWSSWWEWRNGSRLFFWRWPEAYRAAP